MRALATGDGVRRFFDALGHESKGPGRVYVTGGATAVLHGWRETTADIDIKMDPEPAGAFSVIRVLKDRLDLNVELASPDDFIPPLPGWQDRSIFIGRFGSVDFYHYDPYAQTLAKIERSHARDLSDARAMVATGWVDLERLVEHFDRIADALERYPSVDADVFREKLMRFVASERTPS